MFHRFSPSARSIVFRARDIAQSESRNRIEPEDVLFALTELHPTLFERLSDHSIDLNPVREELAQLKTRLPASPGGPKLNFNEECRQVLIHATRQARSCWEEREAPRRKQHHVLPEDVKYWEARLKKPLRKDKVSGRFASWLLRRTWEADERHLLLGLLQGPESSGVAVLTKQGVTLEQARKRLCAASAANLSTPPSHN